MADTDLQLDDAALRARNRRLAAQLLDRARAGLVPDPPPRSWARKLFIVGCPRSGTTWVRDIVDHHYLTITGKETHLYADVFAPVARRSRESDELRGWTQVLYLDDRHRHRRTGGHLHRWLARESLLDLVVRAMASTGSDEQVAEHLVGEIYDRILADHGATDEQVLVDKTPGHLRHARRILRQFPEAKVVEVLRDGRDVCVSMEKLERGWTLEGRPAQITRWIDAVETGMALRTDPATADRVMLLRYEDLKADTAGEITRLFDFAGLSHTQEMVARIAAETDFSTHKETGEGHFFRKGVVGDWVNNFSDEDQALFREMVGDLFEKAGYRY